MINENLKFWNVKESSIGALIAKVYLGFLKFEAKLSETPWAYRMSNAHLPTWGDEGESMERYLFSVCNF